MAYISYSCVHLHIFEKTWSTVKNSKFIITYSEYEYESANRAKYPVRKWTLQRIRLNVGSSQSSPRSVINLASEILNLAPPAYRFFFISSDKSNLPCIAQLNLIQYLLNLVMFHASSETHIRRFSGTVDELCTQNPSCESESSCIFEPSRQNALSHCCHSR